MRILLAVVPLVALGACSLGGDPSSPSSPSGASSAPATPSGSPSPTPTSPGSGGGANQPDASGTPACAEVRAGIDDFNTGDLEGTVAHFEKALPLARSQAARDDSAAARDLLAAVRYYADLAPADYPSASATSPQFAKYKIITLGQCVPPGQDSPAAPSGSPGVPT